MCKYPPLLVFTNEHRFADCDMFARFAGIGVSHVSQMIGGHGAALVIEATKESGEGEGEDLGMQVDAEHQAVECDEDEEDEDDSDASEVEDSEDNDEDDEDDNNCNDVADDGSRGSEEM